MKLTKIIYVIVVIFLLGISTEAQIKVLNNSNVKSEGKLEVKDGQLMVDRFVIKFNKNIIKLSKGIRNADKNKVDNKFIDVTKAIAKIDLDYGPLKFIKQVPNAQWGDTIRYHSKSEKRIKVHDYSQLFTVKLNKMIPMKKVLKEFETLKDVEFVHQPITIVYEYEPNDPKFVNNEQWNLDKIEAEKAWDITTGLSTQVVGIVDDGFFVTHEDLQNKITTGNSIVNKHGTWVAELVLKQTTTKV